MSDSILYSSDFADYWSVHWEVTGTYNAAEEAPVIVLLCDATRGVTTWTVSSGLCDRIRGTLDTYIAYCSPTT
jgi:hypothetical protein